MDHNYRGHRANESTVNIKTITISELVFSFSPQWGN